MPMQFGQMHYLPLTPGFFAILVFLFLVVVALRFVRYAFESLGVSSGTAMFLLFGTLVGSIFNIPIAELPPEQRDLVRVAFYEDLSHSQVAERTGLPLGTVKSRLRLAFAKLKLRLADDDGDESAP